MPKKVRMKFNNIVVIAIVALCFIGLLGIVMDHWSKVDADNNAFAKECNDRGGYAEFDASARQCLFYSGEGSVKIEVKVT